MKKVAASEWKEERMNIRVEEKTETNTLLESFYEKGVNGRRCKTED